MCTTHFHLCHYFFFLFLFFFVCLIRYGFNHCDQLNSNTQCIVFSFNPVSRKVSTFHNEHILSLSNKLGTIFLTLSIGILHKSAISS